VRVCVNACMRCDVCVRACVCACVHVYVHAALVVGCRGMLLWPARNPVVHSCGRSRGCLFGRFGELAYMLLHGFLSRVLAARTQGT
jgi:hypothetical protein